MFFNNKDTKKVKRVFLVRHGQSESNIDPKVNLEIADHEISLTKEGCKQAKAAGKFLEKYIEENLSKKSLFGKVKFPKIRMWNSPYKRTRQTAENIYDHCAYISDMLEHTLLVEQRFGIFDGLTDKERLEKHPLFHANYEKSKQSNGKIWPKMPLGDSRFDVCQRVHQSFGTFHRDAERHDIENIVVVGHGTTNRAFIMMWMHYPYEWMDKEPNPNNCSIRLIENGIDKGYIFKGYDKI